MDLIAPFFKQGFFGLQVSLVLGFGFGFLFGVALEQAGFGNSRKLTAQFYLHDMAVYKVMFTAVVTSMFLTAVSAALGILDFGQLYIPATFLWPQIIGGTLLGMGFTLGGYCPGTSVVAVGSGKLDGLIYVGGFMAGLLIFPLIFDNIEGLYNAGSLGIVTLYDWVDIPRPVMAGLWVAAAIGSFFGVARLEAWAKKRWPSLHY